MAKDGETARYKCIVEVITYNINYPEFFIQALPGTKVPKTTNIKIKSSKIEPSNEDEKPYEFIIKAEINKEDQISYDLKSKLK